MDLVNTAKELYDKAVGNTPAQGDTRPIASTTSNAKVVYWHYTVQNFGSSSGTDIPFQSFGNFGGLTTKNFLPSRPASDADVFRTEKGVLDAEIVDIQISKSMGNAAGSFRVSLLATTNWKSKLAPGDWVAIYLLQNNQEFDPDRLDSRNLVMLGSIDRVAKTKQREEDTDKVIVRYLVSGRDFGKALEDCVAWFNPYIQTDEMLKVVLTAAGKSFAGNPSTIVKEIFGLFFGSNSSLGQFNIMEGVSDDVRQALVPQEIAEIFADESEITSMIESNAKSLLSKIAPPSLMDVVSGNGGVTYSNLVKTEIDDNLPGYKMTGTLSQASSGESIWGLMKKESNGLVNDLYVDLFKDEDGYAVPTLALTPHPNSNFFEDTPGKLGDAFLKMNDLYQIVMPNSRIKYEDLGRDDNSRINMVWLETRDAMSKLVQTAAYIGVAESNGIGLPMYQRESILRHGIKVWDQVLENCIADDSGTYSSANVMNSGASYNSSLIGVDLYRSFINQIYDLNIYNHLYDTGTIVTIGDSRAQLGTCLRVISDFDDDDRLYFVEGYTHTWTYPSQWETEWTVTHGQFDNETNPFIDVDDSDGGQMDNETNRRYLVKTSFKKPEMERSPVLDVVDNVTSKAKEWIG